MEEYRVKTGNVTDRTPCAECGTAVRPTRVVGGRSICGQCEETLSREENE